MRQSMLVLTICCIAANLSQASVAVVTNRTDRTVSFRLATEDADTSRNAEQVIEQGDCLPIPLSGQAQLSIVSGGKRKQYRVNPTAMYYFYLNSAGEIDFSQIGLQEPPGANVAPIVAARVAGAPLTPRKSGSVVIPVKILYDDAEVLTRKAWEARMRRRFEEVSRIFRKHCFVEFQIVAVDSWQRPTAVQALLPTMEEFEKAVDPAPAQVAIGFLGQPIKKRPEDGHLGGTRGPLSTHVLVREWVNENTERECLELLVHELGHFLGAVHSPEVNSVMRPNLGDRYARSPYFRIVFDPLNTLAMCLVSQELAANRTLRFAQLSPWTKLELKAIYYNLDRANPKDPAAGSYLRALGDISPRRTGPDPILGE